MLLLLPLWWGETKSFGTWYVDGHTVPAQDDRWENGALVE